MNWDAIGAVAEALGALGVIASLIYVARQMAASTRASEVESKLASTQSYTEFLGKLVDSPELSELFIRGRKDLGALSPEEYIRFSNLALMSFASFSAGYFQLSRGMLSQEDWFENEAVIQFWLRGNGVRQWWKAVGRSFYSGAFAAYIESEAEKSAAGASGSVR